MLSVDFVNGYNMVNWLAILCGVGIKCPSISLWVEFLHSQAMSLYLWDEHIISDTILQQDGPLGPLLFTITLHLAIHKIKENCKFLFHACYLDDETIVGDSK